MEYLLSIFLDNIHNHINVYINFLSFNEPKLYWYMQSDKFGDILETKAAEIK